MLTHPSHVCEPRRGGEDIAFAAVLQHGATLLVAIS